MSNGFVKFRRGLLDHLLDGRLSADEYCVFSLLLQAANFRTGIWRGSGVALSAYLKDWSVQRCQRALRSLASKKYITLRHARGKRGNYPVIIHNFHNSKGKVASGDTSLAKSGVRGHVTLPKVASPATTIEEVKQEEEHKKNTAQPQRGFHTPEQIRQIEAKQTRLSKEQAGRKEAQSIMEIRTQNGSARKDYLEFIALRDAKKLPTGMTWEKWRRMSVEERKKVAA